MLQSQIESIVLFRIYESYSKVVWEGTLLSYPGERGNETGQLSKTKQEQQKLTGIPRTDFSPWLTSPLLLDMMTDFYEKERRWGEREKKVKLQKGMDEGEEERERERESAKKIK